jgi:hypothetical protein
MRRQLKIVLSIISLAAFGMIVCLAQASVLRLLQLEEMTQISDQIVLGRVIDVHAGRDKVRGRIRTRVTLDVERVLRGSIEGETISFDLPGGFVSGEPLQQVVPGVPKFVVGEEAIIFLRLDPTLFCPVTGWIQGKFNVITEKGTGRRIVLDEYGKCRQYRERRAGAAKAFVLQADNTLTVDEFASFIAEIQKQEPLDEDTPSQGTTGESLLIPPDQPLAQFNYTGLKWPDEEIPVEYRLYTGLKSPDGITMTAYISAIKGAFQKWQDVPSSYMAFYYRGETGAYVPDMDNTDGRNVVGWTDENMGSALASTVYWFLLPENELVEFDIAIRRTIGHGFGWSVETPTPSDAYDLHSAILHEVGHTLSLDHVNDSRQVMYGAISNGEMKRELGDGDIAGITFIYPKVGDLSVSNVTAPSSALEHEHIEVSAMIRNGGGQAVASSRVQFYLSSDSTIGSQDVLLGSAAVPRLNQGQEYQATVLVEVPAVSAERNYYVCAFADADEAVTEASEDNNTNWYFPLKIWFDSDADGLPNWWETQMLLNPHDDTGDDGSAGDPDGEGLLNNQEYLHGTNPRLADTDGDGQSDQDEVLAGTNPTDDKSVFLIRRIVVSGSGADRWVAISWTTVTGKRYQLYYQDELGMPWLPLGPVYNGSGGTMSYDDLDGLTFPSRVYRVGVE